MTTQIADRQRRSRKPRWCQICATRINVGDLHHVSTNVYDGRIYDFRTCLHCERDGVVVYAYAWDESPEGVTTEEAGGWAEEVMDWTSWGWSWKRRTVGAAERFAARAWMARAAGGEGE